MPSFEQQHRRALARLAQRERRHPTEVGSQRVRLGEIKRLLRARYGRTLPDDDAGRGDLYELINVISTGTGDTVAKTVNIAADIAPWFSPEDAERAAYAAKKRPAHTRMAKADTLAKRLRLSYANREALKIRTIGAFDVDKEGRAAIRKKRDKKRKEQARRAMGMKSREQFEARRCRASTTNTVTSIPSSTC